MSDIHLRFQVYKSARRDKKNRSPFQESDTQLQIDEVLSGTKVTAVYGASGAGKTTLLKCIAGLQRAAEGFCRVGDQIWQDQNHFTPTHDRALGYVFQHGGLFDHMTVKQNLEYGLQRTSPQKRKVQYKDALELLGLEALIERLPGQLSGGERQRAAMAQAILRSPRLLLMDEPLASLDAESKQAILPYLEHIHNALEIPVIYVSHALDEILRIADNLLYLDQGKVIANGALSDLLVRTDLSLAHLDEAAVVIDGLVDAIDTTNHLTEVKTTAGIFFIGGVDHKLQSSLRLRIAARDVSIALSTQDASSLQHRLTASIVSLTPHEDPAKVLVELNASGESLLASITRKSAKALALSPGDKVYAQVKSVALV